MELCLLENRWIDTQSPIRFQWKFEPFPVSKFGIILVSFLQKLIKVIGWLLKKNYIFRYRFYIYIYLYQAGLRPVPPIVIFKSDDYWKLKISFIKNFFFHTKFFFTADLIKTRCQIVCSFVFFHHFLQ